MTYTTLDNQLIQSRSIFTKPVQKLTYIYLTSFVNCEKIFPSIDRIAEGTCQSERNAMRVIKELEDLGAVKVERTSGKSNVYTLVPFEQFGDIDVQTPAKTSGESMTKRHSIPVTESHPEPTTNCHTNTKTLLKQKDKNNNNSLTSESIIVELMNQFPNVPVREIAKNLESDSSVTIKTINQFKGLLTYRVKNYKPIKQANRKSTRNDDILVQNYENLAKQPISTDATKESIMAKIYAFRNAQ